MSETKEKYFIIELDGGDYDEYDSAKEVEEVLDGWVNEDRVGTLGQFSDEEIIVIKGKKVEIKQEIKEIKIKLAE